MSAGSRGRCRAAGRCRGSLQSESIEGRQPRHGQQPSRLQRSSIRNGRVRNKLPDASPMERVRAAVHSPRTGYRQRPSEARSMNGSVSGQVEVAASALDRELMPPRLKSRRR
ncbi:protein of unknown function [Methylorubrum extorquens DM4]|uniref:Uncharacterized protein n=1 Tax=Methylorubrum extorquens (strain DSM 6343 / CIP 106787 / DM4) TaxID=661410 RepID=C7CM44_METED|nr:protein of unknown function [Methylorubrum extorquens DM4]